MMYPHLVFYDGECGLCDQAVQFILKRDKEQLFCFAPLQGETAAMMLKNIDTLKDVDSLILIENYQTNPKIYIEGESVLKICQKLPYPYKILSVLLIIPQCITNSCYRWVARHRKGLMGTTCVLPDPNQPGRFLK